MVEVLFRKFVFETMQLLALCTCEMILSDDNLSLSVRYRAVYGFFIFNSAVIWKQLCCQGQKNFSSDKQCKKTHNEKFGNVTWKECNESQGFDDFMDLVTCEPITAWHEGSFPPLLPNVLCGKPREGRALRLGPVLLGPASGFLLITQISNRCAEAEPLVFIPKCVFFKWQMFFKARKKKKSCVLLYNFPPATHSKRGMRVSKEVVHPVIWTRS